MTKLQELKNKINEAVPEILELKFGCRIKSYCYPDTDIVIDDAIEIDSLVGGKYATHERDNIEILGRPITLEDVLVAIEKQHEVILTVVKNDNGTHITNEFAEVLRSWKWGKPLSQQPKETIGFLYNLLCK